MHSAYLVQLVLGYECKKDLSSLLQITIVGLIIAVKESPTRIDYEVDDMTGPPLEVKQFVDNDVSNLYYYKALL